MALSNQMEMFEDGGLKDEGGMIDEVSGNDVPSGSTREEVRDDIPAQLSEGEFVFPADVVRFLGLEKLMQMRQKAKMGLQKMESMGQMGNSDEATMPDDMPFDLNDLDMQEDVDNEEDVEYNKGGVVKAAVGAYVPPALPTSNPYDPTKNVYTGQTNEAVTPYMPKATNILGASDPSKLVGGVPVAEADSDMFEQRRYVNEATGQVRFVSFNKATGQSTTNVKQLLDQGFIRKDEAIKEAAKTSTPTASTQPSRPEESDNSYQDQMKEEEEYGIGAGRVNLGGTIDVEKTNRLGGPVRGSSLTKGSTTFGIQYGTAKKGSGLVDFAKGAGKVATIASGGIGAITLLGKNAFDAYQYSIGNMPEGEGKVGIYTVNGIPTVVDATVANAIAREPMGAYGLALIEHSKKQKTRFDEIKKANPKLSKKEITKIVVEQIEFNASSKDIKQFVEQLVTKPDSTVDMVKFNNLSSAVKEDYYQASDDVADETDFSGSGEVSTAPTSGYGESDGFGYGGTEDAPESFDSGDYEARGGLLTKRKASGQVKDKWKKKMKRGGLASR